MAKRTRRPSGPDRNTQLSAWIELSHLRALGALPEAYEKGSDPNGLPYSRDGDVVTVIEAMSVNALDAAMNTSPTFSEFQNEINANRPLISFVPGHSRTVAGYTRSFLSILGTPPFRGLLVYDPWPPNAGVITRWENFNATTYRRTFTAVLHRA